MKKIYRYGLYVLIFIGVACSIASAREEWMPDANLRQVVSEKLGVEIFTIADMQQLYELVVSDHGIKSLKGLEHATNLETLLIADDDISDLIPYLIEYFS